MDARNGGPAFPQPSEQRYSDPIHGVIRPSDINGQTAPGMSMRDYFAGQALPNVLGSYLLANGNGCAADHALRNVPALAYKYADAMLAERNK